ncbi:uncharacterized protein LOC131883497 [Tigriopus californicus]|uniref:uncharacterized protein LOC131883497 n=1 Tax=Tigriopus californicus TaxID=6832 RepID=UPI0027DAB436|nr:uncharacterized protein LOC131883497 [Tigriopus californicus]
MEHKALTKEKIAEILKQHESTQDVQLIKMDLKSGAEKGQNYSGLVVSCHIEAEINGQVKVYNWMAKVPLDDPDKYQWLRLGFMEQKELGFYQDLVPALEAFIRKQGSDIQLGFCPLVYGEFDPKISKENCVMGSMIVMEHLAHMGYTDPIHKKSGLDLTHVKLVMKSLANFHAASRAFYKSKHGSLDRMVEKEPIQARDYMCAQPSETMMAINEIFNKSIVKGFCNTLANSSPEGEKYVEAYQRFAKEQIDPLKLRDQLTGPEVCRFNVLCHGDPWFSNMLFKYEDGPVGKTPTDVCLVDLALTKWASPTIDLSYFLYMSTTPELRKAHMDEIMAYYHQTLTNALKQLGEDSDVISLSELWKDYKKCSFFGFMMALMILPWILAKKEDAMSSDEFSGDFSNEEYMDEFHRKNTERTKVMMTNEPQIGERISSAFLEMVDFGYFTLWPTGVVFKNNMDHNSLTQAKFLEILKKTEATEDVQLTKVELNRGADDGQNYSGQVVACHLEAKVKGQPKIYNWMAKVPYNDTSKFVPLRLMKTEVKELAFYQDLLPALKHFIAKRGSKIQLKFCPFIYGEFNEDIPKEECGKSSVIMLEHLGNMGFIDPIDKKSGLDLAHVNLVMKALANFHAASRGYYKAKHGKLEKIVEKEPLQATDYYPLMLNQFTDTMVEGFFQRFMNIGDDGYKYVESYKRFAENVIDPIQLRNQLTGPYTCRFSVLCHGDIWFNNMLFKYEDQNPTDVCLVDLARTKWASPTIDLSFFLFMSTTPELRQAHMNEILEYYHQHLSQALKELGEDPSVFSLSELKADYKKCSFFGFMMSMAVLPIVLARKEDAMGSDEMIGDFTDPEVTRKFAQLHSDRAKASMIHEPQIGHRISRGFMEMVENGYFTL